MEDLFHQTNKEPLMEACCAGHPDIVRMLIQAGADINSLSSTNTTALIYACEFGHIECVKELLASGRCDLSIRNDSGHCALMEAAMIGDVEIMKLLVKHGARLTMVEGTDYKESALTLAAFKGHYDAVKYLLSLMPGTTDTQEDEEEELYASLVEASMEGHLEVANLLLNAGAKINLSKGPFENPLTLAAGAGHTEMVKLLLSAGAEMEGPNEEGYTALMEASREGHFDVVQLLLDRGANVNAKVDEGQETPLTLAASGGFKDVVELLVTRGGDLTIGECTPLYEACQEGHEKVAQFIIQQLRKSYPLQTVQKDLNEALLCTAGIDCDSICKLLIENGAQIDCFSKENRTPLMEAARQNCTKVVELLIKSGADVNKIASPYVPKDVDFSMSKSKSSKKLSQKNCCPTTQCPCCVPASIKKSSKEVCTAAGIPTTPFSTGSTQNNTKKVTTSSRSSTPIQNKRVPVTTSSKSKFAIPPTTVEAVNKTERSLSTSSSSITLSDPSACVDYSTISDAQNNDTALTLACVGGHSGLVDLLIKRGAHIEHRDKKGFTPLILAATGGHVEVCKLLIDAGAQLDAQADRTKDTALSLACSGGRKDVAELLLKHGANKEHRNLSDYTPLSLAASGGYVDIIQLLLNNGAEINSRTNSKLGISPLMLAAMNGHEEAARILLENGSDINAQIETNKNTALTLACFQGRAEVTRLLIQYGANVEHRAKDNMKKYDTGLTPLMEAANGGYVEVGTVLIQANADVNTQPVPTSRDTALTIAADKGHAAFVGLLLRHDAQINARNKKGCTAIWLASNNGHLDTVQVLVAYNADIEAQDNRKLTPLMVAFRKGHAKLVHFLVKHVTQFPSDSDCQRFISTLTDKEMIERCCQSVQYISEAKEKQAEQANKAAQSLLALLAQEKAIEEAKRLSKQRQKEKKRSKKQAKKENEQHAEMIESDAVIDEKSELIATKKKTNEDEMEENATTVTPLETETKKERILLSSPKANTTQNRKQTQDSSVSTNEPAPNHLITHQSNKIQTSSVESNFKNSTKNSNTFTNTEVRVNKKRPSVKVAESVKTNSVSNCVKSGSSASFTQHLNGLSHCHSYSEEQFNELNMVPSRRPSLQVLNIAANAIARVIGRGGSNVNTIREATGAHVEVEKQSTRKEQTTRKITLKGSAEAVRNALRMIDLLLKDHNMLINEIVERVMAIQRKSPSLSSSSETSSCQQLYLQQHQRVCTPPLSSVSSSPVITTTGKMSDEAAKMLASQSSASRSMGASTIPLSPLVVPQTQPSNHTNFTNSPTTNVWQKRAEAIREKKAILNGHSLHGLVSPISSQNNITSQAVDHKKPEFVQTHPAVAVPQMKSLNAEELAILSKEEHQRKAPGYARPQSSASTTNHQQFGLSNGKTDGSPNASSLFDVFTLRWSTSPLEPTVGSGGNSSNGDSDLQNSWNYLLEDWENNRQQRQIRPIFQNFWYQNL